MTSSEKKQLQITACKVRMGVIESTYGAKAGHPGGSLSAAEVYTYLYFKEMNIDPKNPKWEDRDRFVLSKGHTTPGLYSTLAHRGFFPVEDLPTFRHIDSYLQGHPNMNMVPGVDMSTGSLGQGVSVAVGMAKGAKYTGKANRVYTLLGDGEIQEGQVWEACMAAAHYKLDNFVAIVDKLIAFGFNTIAIDGHNFDEIEAAFENAKATKGKPTAIVMKTTKGKNVSFMENNAGWHGKSTNPAEFEIAMGELKAALAELEA